MANIRYPVEKSWKIIPISAAKDWLALQGPHPSSHDKSWIPSPKGNTWHMTPMISHVFSAQPHKSDSPSPHFCTRAPRRLSKPQVFTGKATGPKLDPSPKTTPAAPGDHLRPALAPPRPRSRIKMGMICGRLWNYISKLGVDRRKYPFGNTGPSASCCKGYQQHLSSIRKPRSFGKNRRACDWLAYHECRNLLLSPSHPCPSIALIHSYPRVLPPVTMKSGGLLIL